MAADLVGRVDAARDLAACFEEWATCNQPLTIQSVEGAGGIGKSTLLDYVICRESQLIEDCLILRVSGNDVQRFDTVFLLRKLAESAQRARLGQAISFSTFHERVVAYDEILNAVGKELENHGTDKNTSTVVLQAIAEGVALGLELYAHPARLPKKLPKLIALMQSSLSAIDKLGVETKAALKNKIRANALAEFSKSLYHGIKIPLQGYEWDEILTPTGRKIAGLNRLLLVIDDYEHLQNALSVFLLAYFLPLLKQASFQSLVLVVGRDNLLNTSPAWDQNFRGSLRTPIRLGRLGQKEVEELLLQRGITTSAEMARAWSDTEGIPFCLQLWLDEQSSDGGSASGAQRFYDRTTRWMDDEQKKWLEAALFSEVVNVGVFEKMLGSRDEANAAMRWFEKEGSVRSNETATFTVLPFVKSRLREYLRIRDPERFEALSARASKA